MTGDPRAELIASMVEASSRVRHGSLPLDRFLSLDAYDLLENPDDLTTVPAAEIEAAHARRGAVIMAADEIIDQCIDDLQEIDFDDDGKPDRVRFEDSFVNCAFPKRHRREYNELFLRRVLVTAVKVAHDLANPDGPPAACTAEEIIVRSIGQIATSLCELAEIEEPEINLDDALLEDADFEFLFDADMDGIEEDPARQAAMGIRVADVADWFSPFNDSYVVHPYAETQPMDRPQVQLMIFIAAKFRIKPEDADQWPNIAHDFTKATHSEPGCLWYDWSRSVDNPDEYVLVEAFRDEEAGAAHVNSEHIKTAQRTLPPYLAETPRIINTTIPQNDWSLLGELAVHQDA